jgi:hypothetical protein
MPLYTTKIYIVVKIPQKTQMISGWGALVSESDRDKPPYLRKVAKSRAFYTLSGAGVRSLSRCMGDPGMSTSPKMNSEVPVRAEANPLS